MVAKRHNHHAIAPAGKAVRSAFEMGYMSVSQLFLVVKTNLLSILMPAKVVKIFELQKFFSFSQTIEWRREWREGRVGLRVVMGLRLDWCCT